MNKIKIYLQIVRPHQYLKNSFIWLPLFFGNKLTNPQAVVQTLLAFVAFCLASSSVYVFNDLRDIEMDRRHPVKKFRPLASGVLSPTQGILFSSLLLILSLFFSLFFLGKNFTLLLSLYLILNLFYSLKLKHLSIIDMICISVGFVLRVFAGGLASATWISHWLILLTFLLAFFLALAKRKDDLILIEQGHNSHRNLDGYNLQFISLSMVLMAAVIIVSYILYTLSPEVIQKHKTPNLYLTSFWVIIGLLRYMQITFVENKSGSPTMILIKDKFLQIIIVLWIGNIYFAFYVFH